MRIIVVFFTILLALPISARNVILAPQIKSLQAVVNQNWLSPAVMLLESNDILHVDFDELSHDYHRYTCHIVHCEADWTESSELFDSDWLEGFNNFVIDNFERSINTTQSYTHYNFELPNQYCRLKMSGNYKLNIVDSDQQETLACVKLMVSEQSMPLTMSVTTNTDIDTNRSHQQISMSLKYGNYHVTMPQQQIQTVVMQNAREDNWRINVKPNVVSNNGLSWEHRKELIFDGGNEYHKYEILDPSHPTMGIDYISWDGEAFQVFPFINEPRNFYIYDKDANGFYYIRNSNNIENDVASDYVWVNYRLKSPSLPEGTIVIDGQWTTESPSLFEMTYDISTQTYTASVIQKQGYYSYQYLWRKADGTLTLLPSEGNFYQTENSYQVLVYYRGIGERTWRLTSYAQIIFP